MGLLFDVTNGEVDDSFAFWLIYLDTLTYVDFISSTIQHTARTDKNRPVSCRDIQSTRHTASVHGNTVVLPESLQLKEAVQKRNSAFSIRFSDSPRSPTLLPLQMRLRMRGYPPVSEKAIRSGCCPGKKASIKAGQSLTISNKQSSS
jgi:hypothetical protein